MEEMDVPEGYRFRPDKYEAINYLRRRVNHQPQPCNLVKEMDVYNIRNPLELFVGMKPNDTELFCFTTLKPSQTCGSRSQRKTDGGTWKEQGSKPIGVTPRKGAPAVPIGLQTSFSFIFKNGGKKEPRRYIMHQYSLPAVEKCRVVFCKIRFEDKKGGRSSCYRSNEEVNSEQQQQGRNYEEEQQAVSGSSSLFVEGGGPSLPTSFPPAGHQYTTMTNNFVNNNSNGGSIGPTGGYSSECTTQNDYEIQASSSSVAVFSTDVEGTMTTTNFVNNNSNTVVLPGEHYYSEEEQQQDQQQYMMMSPSSSAPECMSYSGDNAVEVFPEGGYSSELQQEQQQQYMIINPSSHSQYMNYNEVQGGSSFVFGDPSSMVFSTNQGATHFRHNAEMLNNNREEELRLVMQHVVVPPEIRETNEYHHHQAQAPPRPQPQSDKRPVQGEGTLSEWIRAQSEEWS